MHLMCQYSFRVVEHNCVPGGIREQSCGKAYVYTEALKPCHKGLGRGEMRKGQDQTSK